MLSKSTVRELEEVYGYYGFERTMLREKDPVIFRYALGGTQRYEIVSPERNSRRAKEIERSAIESSILARRIKLSTVPDLDSRLFKEFFTYDATRKRAHADYMRFERKVEKSTGVKYDYKPVKYTVISENVSPSQDLIADIASILTSPGTHFALLEAPAGFGKTCVAYEVYRRLAGQTDKTLLPMMAELARNRTARIFRYVLLDEINHQFPSRTLELTRYQVRKGRLVLVLDGFDELLHPAGKQKATFAEAETMLRTLKDLLVEEACILVTTRKSTLLTGDEFHEWLDENRGTFQVHRFLVERPDAAQWLSRTRIGALSDVGVDVQQLGNPVLYSFIGGLSGEEFDRYCAEPERVAVNYIAIMLRRECERQDLRMTVLEQKEVFSAIACYMLEADVRADTKSHLSTFLSKKFSNLLEDVLSRYKEVEEQPLPEELLSKLLLHAFLDRRTDRADLIGFANDFILGTLVGDSVVIAGDREWIGPDDFVDLAVTAYSVRPIFDTAFR